MPGISPTNAEPPTPRLVPEPSRDASLTPQHPSTFHLAEPPSPPANPTLHDQHQSPPSDPIGPGSKTWSVGKRLGDYELIEEIARGGMGIVFKARNRKLNRIVAIKVTRTDRTLVPEEAIRFQAEAEAAAKLDHPHIVPIYEMGGDQGCQWFSMALIEGQTLAQAVRHGPLLPRTAAEIMEKVARAVDYAHRKGVIHRDIKPGNIMLDGAGQPRITDFGLAKRTDTDSGVTRAGQIIGTPSFMPPEQAGGNNDMVGPAADIYSLGSTLYCLLTGRPPFQSATVLETLRQVGENDPVSPQQLNPAVQRDLETVCLKCLEKSPEKRYESAEALAEDLKRFQEGRPVLATRIGTLGRLSRWCRRNPSDCILTATIAVLLVSITAASLFGLDHIQKINKALETARVRADNNAQAEAAQRRRADDESRQNRIQLERLYADKGLELADRGDLFTGLLWWALPFRDFHGVCERPDVARMRLGLYWRYLAHDRPGPILTPGGVVRWATFSPDTKTIATGSENGTVQIWDAETGLPLGQVMKPGGPVHQVEFSPNGRLLGVATWGAGASIWDAQTGTRILQIPDSNYSEAVRFHPDGTKAVVACSGATSRLFAVPDGKSIAPAFGHGREVSWATFDARGTRIATAAWDGTARIWDAVTGQPLTGPLPHDERGVTWIAFNADGTKVATAGWDQVAKIWDPSTGKLLTKIEGHLGQLRQVCFSPDGKWLATASEDGTSGLWDTQTGAPVRPPLVHQSVVWRAVFSPDGTLMATGSRDGTARLWEAATGKLFAVYRHHRAVRQVAFDPSGQQLIVASEDGTVRVWKIGKSGTKPQKLTHKPGVERVVCSPDGRLVASAGFDGRVLTWDLQDGSMIATGPKHEGRLRGAHFSPDSKLLATAGEDGQVLISEAMTGRPVCPPIKHKGPVTQVRFHPRGGQLLTASLDETVAIWDPKTGKLQDTWKQSAQVWCAQYSPDGSQVAIACTDGSVRTRSVNDPSKAVSMPSHSRIASWVQFDPAGKRLVSCGEDGNAQICDVDTGQATAPKLKHGAAVLYAAFSSDGKWIVTASQDGSAQVWDAETGLATSPPLSHRSPVFRAVFSPDGNWVATACGDGTARIWDRVTGQAVSPLLRHNGRVLDLTFTHDGKKLVTGSHDGFTRLWDVSIDPRSPKEWVEQSQKLCGHRIGANGALESINP